MQVLVHGRPLPRFRTRKSLWLLALLTLRANRPVEREWLAGMLWPDVDQSQSAASLRPALSNLREALQEEGKRLHSPSRHTLALNLADNAEADVAVFDAAIASGTLSALERAVALYRGPLLEGCTEEWVGQDRIAREQRCLRALQTLADASRSAGNDGTEETYWRKAIAMDPLWEVPRRGLMEALARGGNINAALQVYREFVQALRDDPKAAPDQETHALYARLRAMARQRAGGLPKITVGEGEAKTLPVVMGYLPHPMTHLVGREDESLEISSLLRRSRLVTLVGPGGIGKTRLALAVASEVVHEFPDGVWLVALEALSDGGLVAPQIATTLGLRDEPGRTPQESLTRNLRAKRLLLVLDNCEHLLQASAEAVTHLLQQCAGLRFLVTSREALGVTGEILWVAPPLTVPDPKGLPQNPATLRRVLLGYEGVQLFVERAQAVQMNFALTGDNVRAVAQVCARLEGIPLALELAAARVRAMTVVQMAERLDDHLGLLIGGSRTALSRQQTLRATIDWSYALLTELEQLVLARLSVFAGGWTLPAAESVCAGTGIETAEILDMLTRLIDKSLVVFKDTPEELGGRYRLLDMVRQYGAENLETPGETERVKARHRDYFLTLAEEAKPELTRADQGVWLERLEAERDNLRAALNWCGAEEDGAKAGLQLAGALYRFWEMRGHYSEGRTYLAEALAREGADRRTIERARALNAAGALTYYQGDHLAARSLQEEGLAIFRELGDQQGVAWSLNDLGDVAGAQGNREAARALYEESLSIFRELGDRQGVASLLHHLGGIFREQDNYDEARALYQQSLRIRRELGDRQGIAWSLHNLGNVAGAQGDYGEARSLQGEGLAIFRALGDRQGVAWSLNDMGDVIGAQGSRGTAGALYEESLSIFRELGNRQGVASLSRRLGRIAFEQRDYADARALYEESLAIFQELGNRQGVGWALSGLGDVTFEQGNYAAARSLYEESVRHLMELGDKRGVAECLGGLAAVMLWTSEEEKAVRLWGAANALRDSLGAPLSLEERARQDNQVGQARSALGEATFTAVWEEGSALRWEKAVSYALE